MVWRQRATPVIILFVCTAILTSYLYTHPVILSEDATENTPQQLLPDISQQALDPFSFIEAADIFGIRYDDAVHTFGEPIAEANESGVVDYHGATIEYTDKQLRSAMITAENYIHLRDIQMGDTLESVHQKFPDNGDLIEQFDTARGGMYRVLYGEYTSMAQFGVFYHYDDALNTKELIVSDSDYTVRFYFEDDKLSKVIYQMGI